MICKIAVASVKVIKSILSYLVHCFVLEKFVGYDFWRSFIDWWWLVNNSFDRRKLMSLLLKTSAWTGSKIIVEALQNIYYQLKAFVCKKGGSRSAVFLLHLNFQFPLSAEIDLDMGIPKKIWEQRMKGGSRSFRYFFSSNRLIWLRDLFMFINTREFSFGSEIFSQQFKYFK